MSLENLQMRRLRSLNVEKHCRLEKTVTLRTSKSFRKFFTELPEDVQKRHSNPTGCGETIRLIHVGLKSIRNTRAVCSVRWFGMAGSRCETWRGHALVLDWFARSIEGSNDWKFYSIYKPQWIEAQFLFIATLSDPIWKRFGEANSRVCLFRYPHTVILR